MNKSKVAREKAKEVMNLIRAHSTKDNVLAGGLLEFTEQQIKRVVSQAQTEILDKAIEVAENETERYLVRQHIVDSLKKLKEIYEGDILKDCGSVVFTEGC